MTWLGVLLALATSASWALGNVLTQRLGKRVGPARAMIWAMAAGAALATPCALLLDVRTETLTSSVGMWIAVAAVAGVVAYIGLFFAFANEGLATAVPLVSSWSLVAGVVSVLFLGETFGRQKMAGAVAVFAGVVLISMDRPSTDASTGGSPPATRGRALAAALASALGFGVMVPAMGHVAPATGVFGATVVVFALGIGLAVTGGGLYGMRVGLPPRAAVALVLATGVAEMMGFVCIAAARRFAPMTVVAPIATLSSTITVLYAWVVLRERPRTLTATGALLACAGVVLLAA